MKESFYNAKAAVANKKAKTNRYDLRGINIIIDNVIPILNQYTFFSIKGKDYNDWVKLIYLYKEGYQKTLEGRNILRNIPRWAVRP